MIDAEFDHAIILSEGLGDGIAALERLGFRPTPPGYHGAALGTENVTIVLPDGMTYFELLAVREATDRNEDKRAALGAHGRHLYGLAIKGDARELFDLFDALGAAEGEPFDFSREVALPEGPRDARFSILGLKPGTLPGLYGFVCEQHTPDVVWRADYLSQPNGALRIVGLWGVADDLHTLTKAWQRPFGGSVVLEDDRMTAELGATTVTYLSREAWAAGFGSEVGPGARLAALEFQVEDLDVVRALLTDAGLAFRDGAGRIVVPEAGLGTIFVFTAV